MLDPYVAKFTYPAVIHQGDKRIGRVLLAKARLLKAREEYRQAKAIYDDDDSDNTDPELDLSE